MTEVISQPKELQGSLSALPEKLRAKAKDALAREKYLMGLKVSMPVNTSTSKMWQKQEVKNVA